MRTVSIQIVRLLILKTYVKVILLITVLGHGLPLCVPMMVLCKTFLFSFWNYEKAFPVRGHMQNVFILF